MEDSLAPISALGPGQQHQQGDLEVSGAGAAVPDAPSASDKAASTIPQRSQDPLPNPPLQSDKDFIPEPLVQRQDTLDSYRSSFARRTNTGWSTIVSTATDFTEPDLATLNDDPEDQYASSPRPFGFASRSATFQSNPPSRVSSFALEGDNSRSSRVASSSDEAQAPKHFSLRRLQEMSSPRRGRHPGPTPNPGRGPNPPTGPHNHDVGPTHSGSTGTRDDLRGRSASPAANPEPSRLTMRELPIRVKTESQRGGQSHAPVQPIPEEVEPPSAIDTELPDDSFTPYLSDDSDDEEPVLLPRRPSAQLVHDVCDRILSDGFGIELQDLAGTDAASAAYNSVSHCLDELASIVEASGIPIYEVPARGGASGHAPIRPAGNGAGQGSGGGNGGNGGAGGSRGNRPPKRPNGDSDPDREGDDGDFPGDNKKPKLGPEIQEDHNLSCPFRKRNPVKFNVRDHQSCAVQSYQDISLLKRHVKIHHKQKTVSGFACPRCKQDMETKEALECHLAVDNARICTFRETPSSQNPEDGITSKVEDALNGRRANTKVDTWKILWQTLFPLDEEDQIPPPEFVPPVELDETLAELLSPDCEQELITRLQEEEGQFECSELGVDDRVNRLVITFQTYTKEMFERCRQRKLGGASPPPRRKRQKGSKAVPSLTEQTTALLAPPIHTGVVGYVGDSNAGSPSSSSGESWAHVGAPSMPSGIPRSTQNVAVSHSLMNYQAGLNIDPMAEVMVTPNPPHRSAIPLQPQPHFIGGHNMLPVQHRRVDSAVDMFPQYQAPPYQRPGYGEQAMQQPHANVPSPAQYQHSPVMMQPMQNPGNNVLDMSFLEYNDDFRPPPGPNGDGSPHVG